MHVTYPKLVAIAYCIILSALLAFLIILSCVLGGLGPVSDKMTSWPWNPFIFTIRTPPLPLNCFIFSTLALAGRSTAHISSLALETIFPEGVLTVIPVLIIIIIMKSFNFC